MYIRTTICRNHMYIYIYIYIYIVIYVYVYIFQNQGLQEYPQGSPMHINIYIKITTQKHLHITYIINICYSIFRHIHA
jgi:hypothetical protein